MITSNATRRDTPERITSFEELLMEVSTVFISVPMAEIDGVIEDTQHRICEYLDLDLSALWQWSDRETHMLTITHLYSIPGGPEKPAEIDGEKTHPWIYQKMLAGETLAFSTDELPVEAETDKETRRFYGVESSVALPLMIDNDRLLGILTFETLHRSHSWNEYEVKQLQLVAQVLCNALMRKRSEQELIESEARLSLAADSAEAGMWELDCNSGTFWATQQARKIFGYTSDEIVTLDRLERSVLGEDLGAVRSAMSNSFEKREKLKVEYGITTPDNQYKWICSSGRPYFNKDGSPSRMLGISVDISERKQLEHTLTNNLAEIELLKGQIEQENHYLREELTAEQGFEHVVGQCREFKKALASVRQVASTSATVLLLGETGTGKGVVAHTIHRMGERSSQPFVTVNCAALPSNLIESELFGREQGAFTGADKTQVGRFEVANRGTIFLDEVGEMSLEMQAKLLGVLQDGKFERLGNPASIQVDVRVIAATARNLKEDVQSGRFREDLYYRLKVFPITIPPLRNRKDDIPLLAQHFIEKYSRKMGKRIDSISKRSLEKMLEYPWPGNVRELEHLIERYVILSSGSNLVITEQLLPADYSGSSTLRVKDLVSLERDHIEEVLRLTDWKIEGPGGAASILDIHPSTLRFRLKKHRLKRPA
jgi:PAS domain S-box-containing protein